MKRNALSRAVVAGAALAAGYALVVRPWHLKWGASELEAQRPMPGDELIPRPRMESTRAVTIHAPAEKIWPWLVQIGYRRAGWYSYDRLEALAGVADFAEGGSAQRIIPELQNLKPGDTIPAAPAPYLAFTVFAAEPNRMLGLRSRLNPFTGKNLRPEEPSEAVFEGTWVFQLEALDHETTRLVARFRGTYEPTWMVEPMARLALEPAIFLMEQKMLRGIRERAESPAGETLQNA